MTRVRHLKNAPIIEAIIDFRVKLPSDFDPRVFFSLKEQLSDKYPKVEKKMVGSITIKDGRPIVGPPSEEHLEGYRLFSKDKKEVVQFRIDGFTFSKLHPYSNWDEILQETRRLWGFYCLKAQPLVVDKISVHYINRLDVPPPVMDLEEYFTASPKLPKSLPQQLLNYLIALVVPENDLIASIIQTRVESPIKDNLGIIIDIDTFKQSTGNIDDKDIWPTFDRLHELKNHIFFELITEKTARLYE